MSHQEDEDADEIDNDLLLAQEAAAATELAFGASAAAVDDPLSSQPTAESKRQRRGARQQRNIVSVDAQTQHELNEEAFREMEALRDEEQRRNDATSALSEPELLRAELRHLYLGVLAHIARSFGRTYSDVPTLVAHKNTLFESTHVHDCLAIGSCAKQSMRAGEPFFDSERRCTLRASGRVYVCCDSGRAHICPKTSGCVLSTMSSDRSQWLCMFSAQPLGEIIVSHAYGDSAVDDQGESKRLRDNVTDSLLLCELSSSAPSESSSVCASPSSMSVASSSAASSVANGRRRRLRIRRPPVNDVLQLQIAVRERLRKLFFSDEQARYWRQLRARTLAQANAACESELRQQPALPRELHWVVAIGAFMHTANKVPVTRAIFGREPRALVALDEQERCLAYFVECLTHVVQLLRRSPRMRTNNVPLANLAMGVLYRLASGYEMVVRYHVETRRILYNVPREQLPPEALIAEERVAFLPRHGFVRVRLPDNSFAKQEQVLTGQTTVSRLLNDVSASYCALLTPERTIDEVKRDMCLQSLMPVQSAYMSEDLTMAAPPPKLRA